MRDPGLVKEAAKHFPGRVAVGIDAKGGKVAVEGWAETSELPPSIWPSASRMRALPRSSIPTSTATACLKGINLPATAALARATRIPVIASGGLASIADVRELKKPEYSMLEGAITGRALYDGRIDAKEALELLETA